MAVKVAMYWWYSFHCAKNEEILNGKPHFLCSVCLVSIYSFSPTKFLNIVLVSRIQKIQVLMNNEKRSKDMPKYRGSLQTHHVDSTLKRRGNGRFHVVSTWNTCCVCRDDVGGSPVRGKYLSKYNSMRTSFMVVQADEGHKTLTRYNSAFSTSWWHKFLLWPNVF